MVEDLTHEVEEYAEWYAEAEEVIPTEQIFFVRPGIRRATFFASMMAAAVLTAGVVGFVARSSGSAAAAAVVAAPPVAPMPAAAAAPRSGTQPFVAPAPPETSRKPKAVRARPRRVASKSAGHSKNWAAGFAQ
jgi:hypothetical protein